MLPASFSTGPKCVAPAESWAPASAECSRPLSDVERSATSVPDPKNTIEARSDGVSPSTAFFAAASAARPPIAVAHAVGAIDQDHHFTSPARRRNLWVGAAKERACEGEDNQRERRQPHHQQQPVPDPAAPHRLVRDAPQEHQRRKLDDLLPLALDQVEQHRHRQSGEPDQKERREK